MEDNDSQSYDQERIQALRKEIEISKSELIKLAYSDEKLLQKIDELNKKGCECITKQLFYQSIVYLSEAENILQYAAGCGRTIDRTLIIVTLHNQACVYQRIWQLNKSSDYLQAIIYNISNFLSVESEFAFSPQIAQKLSPQYQKLSTYLSSKLQLISYSLQFCAVSSQIKNHDNALKSAQKVLNWLKGYCEQVSGFEKLVSSKATNDFQKNLLQELQNIRNFENQNSCEVEKNIEKLLYKAKKSITVFQKKLEFPSNSLSKEQQRQLENFSLGQLMQVSPNMIAKMHEKLNVFDELSLIRKIYKAIYISIAHFTMATQLRLIANEKHGMDSHFRKLSKQFKESEVHHLVAIITVALYVPCYTKYFEHILNSFRSHYQIDLAQMSELSQSDESNGLGDDLIHLEIQSISQRDSDSQTNQREVSRSNANPSKEYSRHSDKHGISFQKESSGHKTVQDIHYGSSESSQNEYLRKMSQTARGSERKDLKKKKEKSKKKITEHTSREKQMLIVSKITSKSKSKGKQHDTKRSKSRKSIHQIQEDEKVVHYFHYDNYSKKVVKKKTKPTRSPGQCQTGKKMNRQIRDKKSPQIMINNHLKKLNQFSQSTKQLIATQLAPKMLKKGKSPQISATRTQKPGLKKGN